MMRRYREIFYGLLLGLGAWVIDALMHAQMEGGSFWGELFQPKAVMAYYRVLFMAFALALGWLLWQKSKRERDFRQLAETIERFHREILGPAFLIHAKSQALLFKEDFHLTPETEQGVRFIYEQSQKIESAAKEGLPKLTGSKQE